jgi:sorting and assembly machinery component 37
MHDNYSKTTHLALSSFLPIPQRYYVPTRMREMHRPRLEAAGLWNLPGDEVKQQTDVKSHVRKHKVASDEKIAYKKTFDREKVGLAWR